MIVCQKNSGALQCIVLCNASKVWACTPTRGFSATARRKALTASERLTSEGRGATLAKLTGSQREFLQAPARRSGHAALDSHAHQVGRRLCAKLFHHSILMKRDG